MTGRVASRAPVAAFKEVDPSHSDPQFVRTMNAAMKLLKDSKTPAGKQTYEALATGKVKVDLMSDLTRADFARVKKTLGKWGIELKPDAYLRLHDAGSKASQAVSKNLDGYQWDDRIYVHGELSAKSLAVVLVHETSHVLNRSEEHYRSPKAVLLEEYRAFYAERIFAGERMTPEKCKALKARIIKEYELKNVMPIDVPDVPPSNK